MRTLLVALLGTLLVAPASVGAQELHAFSDTSRLVSVGGSLTEIIYALGEEDRLVARDQTAIYPEAVNALPDVGYMRQLAPEGVLSVGPTALLMLEGSGPPEALEVLANAGVEYQTVPESFSAEGVLTKVRAVGEALGVAEKAEGLAAELETEFAALAEHNKEIGTPKRVLFILSTQGGKIQVSGTDTAANGIIALAGAHNAITQYSGYKALTEEAIIEAAPDAIVMMDRGGDHGASDADLVANPAIALTPAGKHKAIYRMDGAYLLGFGPRTPEAAAELSGLLYGRPANGQ